MDDGDRLIGQLQASVRAGDLRIVPLADLAEVNIGEQLGGQLYLAWGDAIDIHDRHDAAHHHRELNETVFLELFELERRVRSAEVDRLGHDLLDAAARADRLVVQSDSGLLLVGICPLGVNGIRECGAGASDVDGERGVACHSHSDKQQREAFQKCKKVHLGNPPIGKQRVEHRCAYYGVDVAVALRFTKTKPVFTSKT